MVRGAQVAVIGYDGQLCTRSAYETARRLGQGIANAGLILVTGGLQGVMKAASEGAKSAGGRTVGIVPSDSLDEANEYCDTVVATGVGYLRNFFVVNSGDVVVIVGGGAGTLTEAAAAYLKRKPIIAIRGTGGVADQLADQFIDERKLTRVVGVAGPAQAVRKALKLLPRKLAPA